MAEVLNYIIIVIIFPLRKEVVCVVPKYRFPLALNLSSIFVSPECRIAAILLWPEHVMLTLAPRYSCSVGQTACRMTPDKSVFVVEPY
jgi:hypothetical protein